MKEVSGTKEWAKSNENIQFGCQHDCLYCYAKAMSVRHKKIDIKNWSMPILRPDKLKKNFGKRQGTIMFPTTHDLHPDQLPEILEFIGRMLKPGNEVLIVSKPHESVIAEICDIFVKYKDKILFRFSIGSARNDVLRFWEPSAPTLWERIYSLSIAFEAGFKTSVSAEPMLDDRIDLLVEKVRPYITDAIWLGKMNNASQRCKMNGGDEQVMFCLKQLEGWQSDGNIKNLYKKYKEDPLIKWKESIKKIVGLRIPTEKGLDI